MNVDMKLEIDVIPVSDVDRAKEFYERLGWRLDDDVAPMEGLRIVQLTPPGSGTSITFGLGLTTAAPGSAEAGLVVSDIEVARAELVGRGIDVSDIWHGPPFPVEARQPGPDAARASYGSFFSVADPDGNTWLVQEVTTRLPGRVEAGETATRPLPIWRMRFGVPRPRTRSRVTTTAIGARGTPPTWWPSRSGRICRRDQGVPRPVRASGTGGERRSPKSPTARRPSRRPPGSSRTRGTLSGCAGGHRPIAARRPSACTAPTARPSSTRCSPTCRSPTGCVSR